VTASAERWGVVRYDPASSRGHVESYFVKANDPTGRRALWLKWTIYAGARAPDRALTELWAVAFDREAGHVGVKSTVPFAPGQFSRDGLAVSADGCTLRLDGARGAVTTAGRRIEYDLSFSSDAPPLVPYAAQWMYSGPLPSLKWVSPVPDMTVRGKVVVNGDEWDVAGWRGMLGHNWGRHAYLYAWSHCNTWDDAEPDEAVLFEGGSGRIKVGPVLMPLRTLLCVWYRGVRYHLNGARALAQNEGELTFRRWRFAGKSHLARIEGELWGETDDFVGLYYANPDGTTTHCLNTKIAHARLELTLPGRPTRVLTSRAAALEIGTRDPSHGVRMYV
jgi:hypothetical protein